MGRTRKENTRGTFAWILRQSEIMKTPPCHTRTMQPCDIDTLGNGVHRSLWDEQGLN